MPYVGTGLNFGGFTATIKDSFTGDGSATDFTLSRAPSNAFDIEVFVGNVRQNPNVAYTVSGTTLAFTGTPANGEVIYAVHQAGGGLTTVLPQSFLGVKDYTIGGNLNLNVDNSSALKFGADQDVTLTHVADTGLALKHTGTADDKPIALILQTGETDIAADDVLGSIRFQAPDEGTGTDALLVAAAIDAVSEGDFSASSNASKLSFRTGSSETATEKMALTSDGKLNLLTDAAALQFGVDSDVTLTHVADTGLLLNASMQLQFNDASQNINAPSATVLDINATDEIELNATLVDVNANLDVSGTIVGGGGITGGGLLTTGGNIVIPDAGNIGSASDTNAIGISSGGVVSITATTANTSASDGALTVAGGLGVAADASVGDDLRLISDAAVLSFGADGDVTLTHVADTGLLLNGTSQLQFNDASQNITAPSATVLDINATDEIELNATLVDVNANLDVSGTYTGAGLMTTGGNIVIPDAGNIGSASDTDSIAIASNGQVTFTQTLIGTALDISGDIDVDGTTNLDVVDIDGAVDMASTLQVDGAITSSAGATITTADNTAQLTLKSTDADASVGPVLKLQRDSSSPAASDIIGQILFHGEDNAGNDQEYARITTSIRNPAHLSEASNFTIETQKAGDKVSRLKMNENEAVFNEDSKDIDFRVESNGNANMLFVDAGNDKVGIGTNSPANKLSVVGGDFGTLLLDNANASHGTQILFQHNGTVNTGCDIQMSDAGGMKIRTLAVEDITFHTSSSAGSPVERMKILSGGNVDISAGHILLDNGYGIDFSATSDASGMASELLDDYEEGTFTPIWQQGLTSAGYATQQGAYTKIGRQVICSLFLRSNSGTENGDAIYLGGLPFTVRNANSVDHSEGAFWTYNGGFWASDANTSWLARVNETNLAFFKQADGGAIQGSTSGVATNLNADVRLVVVYTTN